MWEEVYVQGACVGGRCACRVRVWEGGVRARCVCGREVYVQGACVGRYACRVRVWGGVRVWEGGVRAGCVCGEVCVQGACVGRCACRVDSSLHSRRCCPCSLSFVADVSLVSIVAAAARP